MEFIRIQDTVINVSVYFMELKQNIALYVGMVNYQILKGSRK